MIYVRYRFVKFATQVVQVEEPAGSPSTTTAELPKRLEFAGDDLAPDRARVDAEPDGEGGCVDHPHSAADRLALLAVTRSRWAASHLRISAWNSSIVALPSGMLPFVNLISISTGWPNIIIGSPAAT